MYGDSCNASLANTKKKQAFVMLQDLGFVIRHLEKHSRRFANMTIELSQYLYGEND